MRRATLIFLFLLALIPMGAGAQNLQREKTSGSKNMPVYTKDKPALRGANRDAGMMPEGRFQDSGLGDLTRQMEQREWGSEDSAWQRACALNTKDAYQKYIGLYPNGPHRPFAEKRLIDINVNDMMRGSHNDFPRMKRIESDDESPTSTIVIENLTPYTLTVYFSGPESQSVPIPTGGKTSVTLKNGNYRVGASVPVATVRPFAGSQDLGGGTFEVGFIIARR